jgi:hypothetical protein
VHGDFFYKPPQIDSSVVVTDSHALQFSHGYRFNVELVNPTKRIKVECVCGNYFKLINLYKSVLDRCNAMAMEQPAAISYNSISLPGHTSAG